MTMSELETLPLSFLRAALWRRKPSARMTRPHASETYPLLPMMSAAFGSCAMALEYSRRYK